MLRHRAAVWVGLTLVAAACGDPVGQGYPTAVELTADRTTAAVGEPIIFNFEARGHRLAAVTLDYGDGAQEIVNTGAARTAGGTRSHTYETAGTFVARASALEVSGDSATAVLQVEISEQDR